MQDQPNDAHNPWWVGSGCKKRVPLGLKKRLIYEKDPALSSHLYPSFPLPFPIRLHMDDAIRGQEQEAQMKRSGAGS
jgi:hypothetical protein